MIDLDKKMGPMRIRAWGLVLNFIGNVTGLLGLSMVLANGTGWFVMIAGLVLTLVCVFVLAQPVRSEDL